MLVESLLITSSTSYDTLADMVLKKDAPSADDSKTIPSLQSLHVHLDNDYTASLYLWKNGLVPDHTGKSCEGRFQNKNHRVWLSCKGHYEIRIINPTYIKDADGEVTGYTTGSVVWTPRQCSRPTGGKPCTDKDKERNVFWGTIFETTPRKPANEILRGVVLALHQLKKGKIEQLSGRT